MTKTVKKKWVRLKRFLQRLKEIDPNTIKGDGGLMSNGFLDRIKNKHQNDSTFVIKDTAVVAHPKN